MSNCMYCIADMLIIKEGKAFVYYENVSTLYVHYTEKTNKNVKKIDMSLLSQ